MWSEIKGSAVLLAAFSCLGCFSSASDNQAVGTAAGDRIRVEGAHFYHGSEPVFLFGQGYELAINRQSAYMGFDYRDEAAWYGRFGLNLTRFYPLITSDFGQDFGLPFIRLPSGKYDLTRFNPE